jgi:hypothetical protein
MVAMVAFPGVTACVSTAKAVNTRRDKLRLNALLMQKDLRERTPNRKQVELGSDYLSVGLA